MGRTVVNLVVENPTLLFASFCFFSSQRVVVYRILPALTSEFINPDMVPFVLPNVLLIAEECTKDEYIRLILPDLTPVFKQQEPVQVEHSTRHMRCVYARLLDKVGLSCVNTTFLI